MIFANNEYSRIYSAKIQEYAGIKAKHGLQYRAQEKHTYTSKNK